MVNVKIQNQILKSEKGRLLSDFLTDNGFYSAHPCGGQGTCGKCKVTVNGASVLSCRYIIDDDIIVELPDVQQAFEKVVEFSGEIKGNLSYALDLGTTTLAMALVDVNKKEVLKTVTRPNPQAVFGADVISRIDYCSKNSVRKPQLALVRELNLMALSLGGAFCENLYVSGNTTMLHILFGEDPSSMGVAPYTPQFLNTKTTEGTHIGIKFAKQVKSLPCISTFVGADLVAGLNFTDFPYDDKYNLLVDLGTNAEIVLYSKNKALCTSAAAGPCFEGANISCGMSATDGAVYAFDIDMNNKISVKTISGKKAEGLCGTGLVDVICVLVEHGIIDETGYMDCGSFEIAENVRLLQEDVRQYQLAKSAVYSAIMTLIELNGVAFEQIEKMYISGGFSSEINVENAVATGLLPRELKDKVVSLNNSSLSGTIKYSFEQSQLEQYIENAKYIDLSLNQRFSELFIENMEFQKYE